MKPDNEDLNAVPSQQGATPRTDALFFSLGRLEPAQCALRMTEFARELERALSDAQRERDEMRERCAKAICTRCHRGEKAIRILAGDWMHEKETDGVRHYIPCVADRIHALPDAEDQP